MAFAFGLAATFALVLANAFFVASEFALVKMRPTQLETLIAQGNGHARLALRVSKKLDAYLSAIQLGITVASIALGWIGEPTLAHVLEPLFARLGAWAVPAAHSVAMGASFGLITILHVVLGELAPKSVAIQRTQRVALWAAPPLHAFYCVAYPFIWLLNALSRLALRAVGMKEASQGDEVETPEELRLILRHVRLDAGTRRLMDRLVDYARRVARHVMTLRADLVVLYTDRPFEANMRVAVENQYARYLLVERSTDRIVGYVHVKDIAMVLASRTWPDTIEALARTPLFVRDDTKLEALRREFLQKGVPIAVVTDAQGLMLGAVTLEDVLEEFVGEIRDEHDANEVPPIARGPGGDFDVEGRVTLDVVARELGFVPPDLPEGIETIGGYARVRLGRPPRVGDTVDAGDVRLVVLEVRQRRIARLRGERTAPAPPAARSTFVYDREPRATADGEE